MIRHTPQHLHTVPPPVAPCAQLFVAPHKVAVIRGAGIAVLRYGLAIAAEALGAASRFGKRSRAAEVLA